MINIFHLISKVLLIVFFSFNIFCSIYIKLIYINLTDKLIKNNKT